MSSSKIGLVKITCHESLHSSHDVQFLHKAVAAAVAVGPTTLLHTRQVFVAPHIFKGEQDLNHKVWFL